MESPSVYVLFLKKLLSANGLKEYSQAGRDIYVYIERELAESVRCHIAAGGDRELNLVSRPQPHGATQINRKGLI